LNKFKPKNLNRYLDYIIAVQDIDWNKLVFLDEAHVVSRTLHKKKVLGVVNQRTWVKDNDLHGKSFLEKDRPLLVDLREETNTQWDFVEVVEYAVESEFLCNGDYLVVDNACVHGGADSLQQLLRILYGAGVHLVFLPKYSPELNPCELVFNKMKNYLRYHRHRWNPIWMETLCGLAKITVVDLIKFYHECISVKRVHNKAKLLV